jgi:hypothetical protein
MKCECGNNEFEQEFAEYFGEFRDGQWWPTIYPTRIPVGPWKCSECGKDAPSTNMLPNPFEIADQLDRN